jgi:6-phosphogluconolactonase (cycloisomerase 2 family)
VSNRNTNNNDSRGDSIAIFSYDFSAGKLSLVKQVFTGMNQLRGVGISPDGAYIVASGVVGSGGVAVWKRVSGGADLQLVARNTQVATRTSFTWL